MKIKPALAASLVISAFLFVSSIACLVLQPELKELAPIWQACLLASPMLIVFLI